METFATGNTGVRMDVRLVAGSSGNIHLVLVDRTSGRGVDLTGWSADLTFRDGPRTVLTLTTANGGVLLDASGNIESSAFAADAAWQHAEYSLRLTDPYGNVAFPVWGQVELLLPAQASSVYGPYTAREL